MKLRPATRRTNTGGARNAHLSPERKSEIGRMGGKAAFKHTSPERRKEIAKMAHKAGIGKMSFEARQAAGRKGAMTVNANRRAQPHIYFGAAWDRIKPQ